MREFKSGFVYEFKAGDNIAYNFEILRFLYECQQKASSTGKTLLYKPIIIIIVSIIEALFCDLYDRINEIPSDFPDLDTGYFKTKDLKDFDKLITGFRIKNVLAQPNKFYGYLDFLRKVRNRVHIKLTKDDLEPDDKTVFTEKRMIDAEKICEITLIQMNQFYLRDRQFHHVSNFQIPWKKHNNLEIN